MVSGKLLDTSSQRLRASSDRDLSCSWKSWRGLEKLLAASLGEVRICWKGEAAVAAPTSIVAGRSLIVIAMSFVDDYRESKVDGFDGKHDGRTLAV